MLGMIIIVEVSIKKLVQKPNNWGLHDMHGNVAEWTLDQYSPRSYYSYVNQIADNPYNRAQKLYPRVVRGGSWMSSDYRLRSSSRTPSNKNWKNKIPKFLKVDGGIQTLNF